METDRYHILHGHNEVHPEGAGPLAWLPVLAYAGLIFYLSSIQYPQVPLGLQQADPENLTLHLAEYSFLGLLLFRALRQRPDALLVASILGLAYGLTDELHQAFVPTRTPSLGDGLADGLGSILGAMAARWRK